MSRHHLVRVGAVGHVGRFTAVDAVRYPRGAEVIVRTSRGLEIGEVLANLDDSLPANQSDGSILRGMTTEDHLLQSRLEKNKAAAIEACTVRISELGSCATLLDAELLFDGRGLYFYFLGDVSPELEALTEELSAVYETTSQIRKFADTLADGCGPDCGTSDGGGCGDSCGSGCAVASACGVRKRKAG